MKRTMLVLAMMFLFVPISVFAEGTLVVEQVAQPTNSLAPEGASRLKSTNSRFCATGGNVLIYGIEVMRTGVSSNGELLRVAILRDDIQMGISESIDLGSNLWVGTDAPFIIPAGTCYNMTVVANMSSDLSGHEGETFSLPIIGIWTTSSILGFSWVDGAIHTVNSTLTINHVYVEVSSTNPVDGNVEVGTSGKVFSSLDVTAGSVEDEKMKSVTIWMSGTELEHMYNNVRLLVDGISYPTSILPDGRYYAGGINRVIPKGLTVQLSVVADVVGGIGNTIFFDFIEKTDIELIGTVTGFGSTPTGSGTGFSNGFPWFSGSGFTIVAKPTPPPPPPPPTPEQKKTASMQGPLFLLRK